MKQIVLLSLLILKINASNACTTFFIHFNGKMVFGRNYDWITDEGIVCTNQRGLAKTSMKQTDGNTISWVSRYGSITFNQYGKEFPTGGMNEKGLVVELMWLDGTIYPQPDERPSIGVLQWIQFQLDSHSTVEEVIKSDSIVRITSGGTPLHYLVADANGRAATIVFLDGKLNVHHGKALPYSVLTNDTYDKSVKSHSNAGSNGNNSLERFSKACEMITQYKIDSSGKSLTDESFDILNAVGQGDYTKWSIVYDMTEKKIWFKTQRFKQTRSISFAAFDFSCLLPSKYVNMNIKEAGDISKQLTGFSRDTNRQILESAARQSQSRVAISRQQISGILAYPATIICK
jgi:choloylglycine hydrolase